MRYRFGEYMLDTERYECQRAGQPVKLQRKVFNLLARPLLPPDRVELWDKCEAGSWRPTRTGTYDWRLEEAALRQEWRELQANHP